MAQFRRDRRFYGTIQRDCDNKGIPFVFGEIRINVGFIYSRIDNQDNLGQKLDEMAFLILHYGVNVQQGKTVSIIETDFFLK